MLPSTLLCAQSRAPSRVVREVLVERLVVLVLQLGFRTRPKSLRLIQRLVAVGRFQHDGNAQVIRVLAHQLAQARGFQKFLVLIAQMQDDLGAAIGLVARLNLVLALAVRIPAHRPASVRLLSTVTLSATMKAE